MWSSPEAKATLDATNAAPALPAARTRRVLGERADAAAYCGKGGWMKGRGGKRRGEERGV